jgi:ribosomal protein L24
MQANITSKQTENPKSSVELDIFTLETGPTSNDIQPDVEVTLGAQVTVIQGEHRGQQGVVIKTTNQFHKVYLCGGITKYVKKNSVVYRKMGSLGEIRVTTGPVKCNEIDLNKIVNIGDQIAVICGKYRGQQGVLTKTTDQFSYLYLSDGRRIRVKKANVAYRHALVYI